MPTLPAGFRLVCTIIYDYGSAIIQSTEIWINLGWPVNPLEFVRAIRVRARRNHKQSEHGHRNR
jgi:hypothetical protein